MSEYEGREQSLVKHLILRKYLERFAHIIFSHWTAITYVDCFSGPWNVRAEDLSDSSFAIALQELRKARDTWSAKRRDLRIRCYFIERDQGAYRQLDAFAKNVLDAEIATQKSRLDEATRDILHFVKHGGQESFPFFFVDPTGWTGFELDVIEPLLKCRPGEVLVNLMTSFIRRFIKSPDVETRRSFERTFGPYRPSLEELRGLAEEDLDDAIVGAYSRLVRETGAYDYVCNAVILHPDIDSTQFRLIYGTRSLRGVEVFKKVEQAAMPVQESLRATVRGRKIEDKRGPSLFPAESMGYSKHYPELRRRYLSKAKRAAAQAINHAAQLPYDTVYAAALAHPMVWESDLKEWIAEWQRVGHIELTGLKSGQRVPKHSARTRLQRLSEIPIQ